MRKSTWMSDPFLGRTNVPVLRHRLPSLRASLTLALAWISLLQSPADLSAFPLRDHCWRSGGICRISQNQRHLEGLPFPSAAAQLQPKRPGAYRHESIRRRSTLHPESTEPAPALMSPLEYPSGCPAAPGATQSGNPGRRFQPQPACRPDPERDPTLNP